jgi:hypothetical protein
MLLGSRFTWRLIRLGTYARRDDLLLTTRRVRARRVVVGSSHKLWLLPTSLPRPEGAGGVRVRS